MQTRYNLLEDFLQVFYCEALNAFRRENTLPNTYQPRTQLELAEYMAFTEQYAKRRIPLPGGQNEQLIVLRAQRFSQCLPTEVNVDIEKVLSEQLQQALVEQLREQMAIDATDFSEGVLHDFFIAELIQYLKSEGQEECVDYLLLKLKGHSAPEIEEILRLSPREKDYLAQRLKHHIMKFARSKNWKLVYRHFWADLKQILGLSTPQWESFLILLTPEQLQILELKQSNLSDMEIAAKLKITRKQLQKRLKQLLGLAQKFHEDETT